LFDGLLRIFFRPLGRFFRRITDLAKDATRLRLGVRHAESILDQLSDAATCPDRVGMAELGRAFFEKAFEFCELLGVELWCSTGSRFGRESFDAVFGDKSPPKSDGRKAATDGIVWSDYRRMRRSRRCRNLAQPVSRLESGGAVNP